MKKFIGLNVLMIILAIVVFYIAFTQTQQIVIAAALTGIVSIIFAAIVNMSIGSMSVCICLGFISYVSYTDDLILIAIARGISAFLAFALAFASAEKDVQDNKVSWVLVLLMLIVELCVIVMPIYLLYQNPTFRIPFV